LCGGEFETWLEQNYNTLFLALVAFWVSEDVKVGSMNLDANKVLIGFN